MCAWTLALAHARFGHCIAIERSPRRGRHTFNQAVLHLSIADADQNERDDQAPVEAVRVGLKLKPVLRESLPMPTRQKQKEKASPNVISGSATAVQHTRRHGLCPVAGVNPVYGLYSGIVATIVSSLSTGTILMMSTLTSAIALTTASVMQKAGIQSSQMPQAPSTITFLTGAIMFVLGIARLGSIVNFVSNAVMTGFVAGASLFIILGQEHHLTGYNRRAPTNGRRRSTGCKTISQWDWTTVAVSMAVIIFMVMLKRIQPLEKYAAIIVLIVATIVRQCIENPDGIGGQHRDDPQQLPAFMLPNFSLIPQLFWAPCRWRWWRWRKGQASARRCPIPMEAKPASRATSSAKGWEIWREASSNRWAPADRCRARGSASGPAPKAGWAACSPGCGSGLIVLLFGSSAEKVPLAVIGGMLTVIGVELIMARVPSARW